MTIENFNQSVIHKGNYHSTISEHTGIFHWSMNKGRQIAFQKDDVHTLSLYVKGGRGNFNTNEPKLKGTPGLFCFMPQGQESYWTINEKVEFIHLYFTESLLKTFAARTFAMDTRFVELTEQIFINSSKLRNLLSVNYLSEALLNKKNPLEMEQFMNEVMHYLLLNFNGYKLKNHNVKGGLSPAHMKIIRKEISERLSEKLTINTLANRVQLSAFHFARMFKLSFGMSPAKYIIQSRIDHVKYCLQSQESLSSISIKSGFNHQSHMTQSFKKHTGLTPAKYRKILRQ